MSALLDQFGRSIEYLRISVTDRCNFRCSYCMPVEGLPWLPKSDILSYEEIRDVVAQLAPMGGRWRRFRGRCGHRRRGGECQQRILLRSGLCLRAGLCL